VPAVAILATAGIAARRMITEFCQLISCRYSTKNEIMCDLTQMPASVNAVTDFPFWIPAPVVDNAET
jgi:hypothetical protein